MKNLKLTTQAEAIKLLNNGKIQISCRSNKIADEVCKLIPNSKNDFSITLGNTYLWKFGRKINFSNCGVNIPTVTAKRFLSLPREEKPEIKVGFPQKWCILVDNSNYSVLNDYLQNNSGKYPKYNKDWIVDRPEKDPYYFYSESKTGHSNTEFNKEFTKINNEQLFEKFAPKRTPILTGGWCVKNDGSQEFKDVMKVASKGEASFFDWNCIYYGYSRNNFFVGRNGFAPFNNNILTLPELKELIGYKPKVADPTPNTREILGYIAPMDMEWGCVKKGDLYTIKKDQPVIYQHQSKAWVLPAELVEAYFTPKYAETEQDLITELINNWENSNTNIDEFAKSQSEVFTIKRK